MDETGDGLKNLVAMGAGLAVAFALHGGLAEPLGWWPAVLLSLAAAGLTTLLAHWVIRRLRKWNAYMNWIP
jgi:hypothetical protein